MTKKVMQVKMFGGNNLFRVGDKVNEFLRSKDDEDIFRIDHNVASSSHGTKTEYIFTCMVTYWDRIESEDIKEV